MDRRSFLKTTGAAAGGAVAGAASIPAGASAALADAAALFPLNGRATTTRLKLACSEIAQIPGADLLVQQFAELVANLSDNRLQIALPDRDALTLASEVGEVPGADVADTDAADILFTFALRPGGQSRLAASSHDLFSFVPYGLDATHYQAWLGVGGGQLLWDSTLAPFNIKPLPVASLPIGGQLWLRNAAGSGNAADTATSTPEQPADLSGLRVAVPALAGAALELLGAKPIDIGDLSIAAAFATGQVEAILALTALADHGRGLAAAPARRFATGFAQGAINLSAGLSLDLWQSLPMSDRAILATAAMRAGQNFAATHFAQQAMASHMLARSPEHSSATLSAALETQLYEATRDALAMLGEREGAFRRVHDSQNGFRAFVSMAGGENYSGV